MLDAPNMVLVAEASEVEPGLQKNIGSLPLRNLKCELKTICVL
jgi:hypothetical protein